jgi:hypothetical protein
VTIPATRHPAPALPLILILAGVSTGLAWLVLTWAEIQRVTRGEDAGRFIVIRLGFHAGWSGFAVAALVSTFGLARTRRSPGAALATAALAANVLAIVPATIAFHVWPLDAAFAGWRGDVLRIAGWQQTGVSAVFTGGLIWAAWGDHAVRVVAAAAFGAALLSSPPPPIEDWLFERFVLRGWELGGLPRVADPVLVWSVPVVLATLGLCSSVLTAWIAHRLPRVPADAMAPRPPARALRWFAAALVTMAVVAIVAGLVIAVVQGKPASETGALGLYIPIAVGLATAGVAAALLALSITDVGAAASRRYAVAAALVTWCVTVTAAQTLWSRRPQQPGARFTVFESPWMPGMVGAAVAVAALHAIAGALDATARALGQRPSRAQSAIVVLALVIGAATVPWLLGFGTRAQPMDGLRVATLASAAAVNLAAWMALARAAWRCGASVPR